MAGANSGSVGRGHSVNSVRTSSIGRSGDLHQRVVTGSDIVARQLLEEGWKMVSWPFNMSDPLKFVLTRTVSVPE